MTRRSIARLPRRRLRAPPQPRHPRNGSGRARRRPAARRQRHEPICRAGSAWSRPPRGGLSGALPQRPGQVPPRQQRRRPLVRRRRAGPQVRGARRPGAADRALRRHAQEAARSPARRDGPARLRHATGPRRPHRQHRGRQCRQYRGDDGGRRLARALGGRLAGAHGSGEPRDDAASGPSAPTFATCLPGPSARRTRRRGLEHGPLRRAGHRLEAETATAALPAPMLSSCRAVLFHDSPRPRRHLVIVLQPWINESFRLPLATGMAWRRSSARRCWFSRGRPEQAADSSCRASPSSISATPGRKATARSASTGRSRPIRASASAPPRLCCAASIMDAAHHLTRWCSVPMAARAAPAGVADDFPRARRVSGLARRYTNQSPLSRQAFPQRSRAGIGKAGARPCSISAITSWSRNSCSRRAARARQWLADRTPRSISPAMRPRCTLLDAERLAAGRWQAGAPRCRCR